MRTIGKGILFALFTTTAMAQSADDKAIRQYDLSMDKVVRYDVAARSLEAAMQKDADLKSELQKMFREIARGPEAITMRLNRHPRIAAFYTAEGLSINDAALVPTVLSNACHASESPELAKILVYSDAQFKFCRDNNEALHKLRILSPVRPAPMEK